MSHPLLAFDTSTETMSVALAWGDGDGARLLEHTGEGGRQASSTLVPAAMRLLEEAGLTLTALQAIVFGHGPGSFTGLRTACAVAQGLAFGANRPVLPVETLMAIAEQAHRLTGVTRVVAVLDARMDEVYWAPYVLEGDLWQRDRPIGLCRPEAVEAPAGFTLAGNALAAYGERLPGGPSRIAALPTAAALLRLAPALLAAGRAVPAAQALPLYVRDKVAQTTDERLDARRAREAASGGRA